MEDFLIASQLQVYLYVMCWLEQTHESQLYTSSPNSVFSDISLKSAIMGTLAPQKMANAISRNLKKIQFTSIAQSIYLIPLCYVTHI